MKVFNRTAHYNYNLLEKFEAGIDLFGPEVKSVRQGKVSLNEAFVHLRDGEAYLINAHIHPYQGSLESISPTRPRRLLLHKREIISLEGKMGSSDLTLVPVSIYNKGNIFKLEIAIAKGKKKWDKREALKQKAQERDVEMALRDKSSE